MRVTRKGLTKAVTEALEREAPPGLVFPDVFVARLGRGKFAQWFFTWGDPVRIVFCAQVFDNVMGYERIGRETAKRAIKYEKELQWMSRLSR